MTSNAKLRRRKGEIWVSNNRHLIGHSKKVIGRNANFDTNETKILIKLWCDAKIQRSLITTHKKHIVLKRLAEKMREYGYHRSAEEINTRMKNLKCFYNRLKTNYESSDKKEEPSWRHYDAMHAIMTRRIFSVRPNEIPQRSQDAAIQQEESENSGTHIVNVDKAKPDNEIVPDVEVDIDINDETLAFLTSSIDGVQEQQNNMDNDNSRFEKVSSTIKQEANESSEKDSREDGALLIPKEEPIEIESSDVINKRIVNNKDINTNVGAFMPSLAEYLNSSKRTITNKTNRTITRAANKSTESENNEPKTVPSIITPINPISVGNQSVANPGTATISLVPTNFLLQRKLLSTPQTNHMKPLQPKQIQPRFLYTQPPKPAIVTSGLNGGVKVLLVNTPDKNDQQKNTFTTTCLPNAANIMKNIPQPVQNFNVNKNLNASNNVKESQRNGENASTKESSDMRNLISRLIDVQKQANNIQRQQLEVSRQRLQFEKSIAERIETALPTFLSTYLFSSHSNLSNEKSQQMETESLSNVNSGLLIPKVEIED